MRVIQGSSEGRHGDGVCPDNPERENCKQPYGPAVISQLLCKSINQITILMNVRNVLALARAAERRSKYTLGVDIRE